MICEVCGYDKVIDDDGAYCEHCVPAPLSAEAIDELLAA